MQLNLSYCHSRDKKPPNGSIYRYVSLGNSMKYLLSLFPSICTRLLFGNNRLVSFFHFF